MDSKKLKDEKEKLEHHLKVTSRFAQQMPWVVVIVTLLTAIFTIIEVILKHRVS